MKCCSLCLFIFIAIVQVSLAQKEIAMPGFKFLRSDESYTFLKNNTSDLSFFDRIKYLPLGEESYLSIGGESRSQFQILRNEDWEEAKDDAALFQRFMLHTDWHFGKHFRVFGQLKNGFTVGRNGPDSPLDKSLLSVHQLFAAFNKGASTFEIGRRELIYGSRRLISVREGTNIRQSFDGARWIWQKANHRLDVLAYAYNPQQTGFLDNRVNTDQLLWGAYWVWNLPTEASLNFDIYYLGVQNEETRFDAGNLKETRHSFGLRHWGSTGRFTYNNEFVYQTGIFGNGNINAWTISTETYFRFHGNSKPTFGLKAQIISGDKDPDDDDLQTFNPLYPRGGYFGLLALIGPANLMDIHPSFKMTFKDRWLLSFDWDFFWRHRITDGIYFPSGRLNRSGRNTTARYIGHQLGGQMVYTINRSVEVELSYFLFIAEDFIREVSEGANFSQLGTSISIKF